MAVDTHGAQGRPWTGFDLDGTLATYDEWRGVSHIGEPVKPMCDLVKRLHDEGKDVKILTARVAPKDDDSDPSIARAYIEKWCEENLGFIPPITHEKDALMETLYDDRVHAVEQNTGRVLNEEGWRTTDGGHKIHIADDGIVDKGNPHVLAKIRGRADSSLDDRLSAMLTSYEDPKTKRMKERLAKMREKNEVLRKGNDERRANLAKTKRENERLKADIMKANVERWKRGLKNSILDERSINMKTKSKVVANALAVARNIRAIPVDSKGNGIIERCKIRTADGEVAEVAYIDEDGYVYSKPRMDVFKDGRIRGVPAKTVVRLNADTGTVSEKAMNARWRIIYKNLNRPLFPYGKETYSTKEEAEKRAEELRKQGKKWGSNNSYFVDVVNSKFKPNELVEWRDAHGRHNSAFYVRDNGDRVTVSIEPDGQGGGLEIPKAWVTNSRARNTSSSPFGFFIGELVVIKKDPSKKKYRVKEITETGDIRLEGATQLFDANELDTANYAGPYRSRNAVVAKALNACRAAHNADFPIVRFEVGKIYRAPWDRDWLAKVLSRTDSSIKVAIKSVRDKTWHKADEQVTLRINPRKSEEQGAEVAKGWDWEFWADERAM